MSLVNHRLYFNLKVIDIQTNMTSDDQIDGIRVLTNKSPNSKEALELWRLTPVVGQPEPEDKPNEQKIWLEFNRSQPSSFAIKNNISFNRYALFHESQASEHPRVIMLESHLTDEVIEKVDNDSKVVMLLSFMSTLLNMVPG